MMVKKVKYRKVVNGVLWVQDNQKKDRYHNVDRDEDDDRMIATSGTTPNIPSNLHDNIDHVPTIPTTDNALTILRSSPSHDTR